MRTICSRRGLEARRHREAVAMVGRRAMWASDQGDSEVCGDFHARAQYFGGMRWDDLQILKAIDEHEGSVGPVSDGLRLMDTCRSGQQLDYRRDPPAFAHELQ